jgi:hypothetical protein
MAPAAERQIEWLGAALGDGLDTRLEARPARQAAVGVSDNDRVRAGSR